MKVLNDLVAALYLAWKGITCVLKLFSNSISTTVTPTFLWLPTFHKGPPHCHFRLQLQLLWWYPLYLPLSSELEVETVYTGCPPAEPSLHCLGVLYMGTCEVNAHVHNKCSSKIQHVQMSPLLTGHSALTWLTAVQFPIVVTDQLFNKFTVTFNHFLPHVWNVEQHYLIAHLQEDKHVSLSGTTVVLYPASPLSQSSCCCLDDNQRSE